MTKAKLAKVTCTAEDAQFLNGWKPKTQPGPYKSFLSRSCLKVKDLNSKSGLLANSDSRYSFYLLQMQKDIFKDTLKNRCFYHLKQAFDNSFAYFFFVLNIHILRHYGEEEDQFTAMCSKKWDKGTTHSSKILISIIEASRSTSLSHLCQSNSLCFSCVLHLMVALMVSTLFSLDKRSVLESCTICD